VTAEHESLIRIPGGATHTYLLRPYKLIYAYNGNEENLPSFEGTQLTILRLLYETVFIAYRGRRVHDYDRMHTQHEHEGEGDSGQRV